MKRLIILLIFVLASCFGFAQYQPKPGETVLKLTIAGKGDVVIRLFTDKAPKTTAHIIKLAESGFYNDQKFFKVVKDPKPFLVLFGDPGSRSKAMDDSSLGSGGSGTRVAYEDSGMSNNAEGMVGLSTLPRDRDSGDSQFYILLAPSKFLDGNYTVFGQVASGMDLIKQVQLGDKVTSAAIIRG